MRAEVTGIGVGDVAADGAVGDAVLHLAHRVGEALHFLTGRLQDVERQPLGALGADAGQALQLLDQLGEGIRTAH
jgi:hypothetical protein